MGLSELLADPALLEDWKLYNRFKVVNASYLPNAYVQADFDFYGKVLSGQKVMKPRWKRVHLTSMEDWLRKLEESML